MNSFPNQSHFLAALKDGDSDAATPLWQGCVQRIMAIARKKLGNLPRRVADEEDIAVSAFRSFCTGALIADDLVQVLMDGNMRLNGRLDLAAIVHVGQNNNDPIRTILKSPLLASSSPPIALIAQFDRLISDRLLFFKISGTFERPRVQIETTKILRQESLKFILEKTYNLGGRPNSLLNRSTIRLR